MTIAYGTFVDIRQQASHLTGVQLAVSGTF